MDAPVKTALPAPLDPLALSREVRQPYHNRRVAAVNDHEIRMSVMTHGFPWHHHPDSDETFVTVEGELIVEFEDGAVALLPGQYLTVPAGVRHRTRPGGERSVNLTFEKRGAETIFD
jgi:mannose-6-phosphate isomerase-like protein (cupin superfamily)